MRMGVDEYKGVDSYGVAPDKKNRRAIETRRSEEEKWISYCEPSLCAHVMKT
jgi:hypothetical protein